MDDETNRDQAPKKPRRRTTPSPAGPASTGSGSTGSAESAAPSKASAAKKSASTRSGNKLAPTNRATSNRATPTADGSPAEHAAAQDHLAQRSLRIAQEPTTEPEQSTEAEEYGLSLEELGQTYAQLLSAGAEPYAPADNEEVTATETPAEFDPVAEELVECDQCPITPLSILEAILFVGKADNTAIEPDAVAGMMRGVRSAEIEQLVTELNEAYEREGSALRIVTSGGGLVMQLADEVASIHDRFYGSVREIKLTQAAIDCLAIIAYRPGITPEEMDEQRGQSSGAILNQLVRRQLVEMRREGGKKNRNRRYYPTQRLLDLAGLDSLEELPLAEDFER